MNILIIANHYPVCSARYMADALTRLGHTVYHDGLARGRDIWGLRVPSCYEWKPEDYLHFEATPDTLQVDLAGLADIPALDFVLVMDSDPAHLDIADVLPYPVLVYGVDNHVRDYRRGNFLHYFLAHKAVSIMPWQDDMTYLPCGYDLTVFEPSIIPFDERRYDVSMLGVMYPQRWEMVKKLRGAGFNVLAGTGLVYSSYASAYQTSRISLCLSAAKDVAQRHFETAAMGCIVMTENYPDLAEVKPEGFWMIEDLDNLPGEVERILKDPFAPNWAKLAQEWAKPHTWDARAKTIIDWWTEHEATA